MDNSLHNYQYCLVMKDKGFDITNKVASKTMITKIIKIIIIIVIIIIIYNYSNKF